MKKIPCIFQRDYSTGKLLLGEWHPDALWVRDGEGVATRKWDGTAVMIRGGLLYKRYDAKWAKGTKEYKTPPERWEACQDPDPITGHWPGWVPCRREEPSEKWHWAAFDAAGFVTLDGSRDGTYELVSPKIGGNEGRGDAHEFIRHGHVDFPSISRRPLSVVQIEVALTENEIEGFVFHHPDGRMAKIRRGDFDLPWPVKR